MNNQKMSASDKRQLAFLIFWLIAGIGMVIIGISALANRNKTVETVSGLLGAGALVTGVITLLVRIFIRSKAGAGHFDLDWALWLVLALLLFNTGLLSAMGKIIFIIGGICLLLEGLRSIYAAVRAKREKDWYIPRLVISVVLIFLGITVIRNAQRIFEGMIVLAIGVYFIVHGVIILYEWIGRAKYFRNFRSLD